VFQSNLIRVIAKLDIKGPNLIKGLQFDGHRVLGTAAEFAEIYYQAEADEIIYQDTVATLYGRNGLQDIVSKTAEKIFIPMTVAGGIRTVKDVEMMLKAGADKVAINTAAIKDISVITESAKEFGAQCIVSSIEAYNMWEGGYKIWTDYGREVTDIDAVEWAKQVEEAGAGEILLTCITNDGMGKGFDYSLTNTIAGSVSIPVIASGGAGCVEDFHRVVTEGRADAVCAASCFHYQYATAKDGQQTMQNNGSALRMGRHIDTGNIDFLNEGYGGEQTVLVDPLTVKEVKQYLRSHDVKVRL